MDGATVNIHTPNDAFAAQTQLAAFTRTEKSMTTKQLIGLATLGRDAPPEEIVAYVHHTIGSEVKAVINGTTVFISADVSEFVDEAAALLPSEVLLEQDLPCPDFTLWMERPYRYEWTATDGIKEGWDIQAIGISTDREFIRDPNSGTNGPSDGVVILLYATDPPKHMIGVIGDTPLVDRIPCVFGSDWGSSQFLSGLTQELSPSEVTGDSAHIDHLRGLHRWLIALFRLMGEHIEITHTKPVRTLRRSAERAGRSLPEDGYISVIRMRKAVYTDQPDGVGFGSKLRFRHHVAGHWRKFYCSSSGHPVGDERAYRYRYVNSYVRGPGDTTIASTKVIAVTR